MYTKKTGEVHTFNTFFAVKQSPNSEYLAVATSDIPMISADTTASIDKITILDRKGVVNFGQHFGRGIFVERFAFLFSADSRYLNFYSVEESSITYHSLDLKTGELHNDVARDDYGNLLTSRNETSDSYFTYFVPVNNNELAAMTNNFYIGYYKNSQPLWIKKLDNRKIPTKLINVGKLYLVVLNDTGGIELFRKSDGKQYKIIQSVSEDFNKPGFNYLDSSFIDTHKMTLTYRVNGSNRPITVIIDFEKRVSIKP